MARFGEAQTMRSFIVAKLQNMHNTRKLRRLKPLSFPPNLRVHLPSRQPMPHKPKLGQNFLDDAQAVERIVAALGDLSGRTVIEIGPGGGAITGALSSRA